MKPIEESGTDQAIAELVSRLSPESTAGTVTSIRNHLLSMLEFNKTTNLTAIREIEPAIRLHVEDSLLFAGALQELSPRLAADLGSGGGYPAIPLALALGVPFTMVESVGKKCAFLEQAVATDESLAMCKVYRGRAEELAVTHGATFDLVTARALAPLPSLVELAAPLLENGGHLAALKATPDKQEIESSKVAARMCGMRMTRVHEAELSGGEPRTLWLFEKVGRASLTLPRRVGLAQNSPLG